MALTTFRSSARAYAFKRWPSVATLSNVVVAILLVAIAAYVAFLGVRQWNALATVDSATEELRSLSRELAAADRLQSVPTVETADSSPQPAGPADRFDNPRFDELIERTSDVAATAGVNIVSVTVGNLESSNDGGIEFEILPMALVLNGPLDGVMEFLRRLNGSAGSALISGMRLAGLDSTPAVHLDLTFFLRPTENNEPGQAANS